jgi:glutathione-specific gamma-glutamylcyclotransferase
LWVFGYGSLMWRPGFAHDEAVHAVLTGAHRALCVYSHIHRGTKQHPGLVLGLDCGGTCEGVAFHVPASEAHGVLAYLRRREQITNVYRAVIRPVRLAGGGGDVRALAYMVNRCHRQYAGNLPLEEQAHLVRRGRGRSGANADYVRNTAGHLRECGIADRPLEALLMRLGRYPKAPCAV